MLNWVENKEQREEVWGVVKQWIDGMWLQQHPWPQLSVGMSVRYCKSIKSHNVYSCENVYNNVIFLYITVMLTKIVFEILRLSGF